MIVKCIKIYGPEEAVRLVSKLLGIDLPEEKKGKGKPAPKKAKKQKGKPAKSVPTADRIKIAPSVKKQCKDALKKSKAAPLFTADEQKKVLDLRKKGFSIKKIAKAVKRSDHAVSAFLKTAK